MMHFKTIIDRVLYILYKGTFRHTSEGNMVELPTPINHNIMLE